MIGRSHSTAGETLRVYRRSLTFRALSLKRAGENGIEGARAGPPRAVRAVWGGPTGDTITSGGLSPLRSGRGHTARRRAPGRLLAHRHRHWASRILGWTQASTGTSPPRHYMAPQPDHSIRRSAGVNRPLEPVGAPLRTASGCCPDS
jgi:hypothetical protein